jgi:glutathione S-transferase
MRLYHAPGAASQAAHIALMESGILFELVKLQSAEPDSEIGSRFHRLTPFGEAPLLELANGSTLREAPAIMGFVADLAPELELAPKCGTLARSRLAEWLHFLSGEVFFRGGSGADMLPAPMRKRLGWIDLQLAQQSYLLGAAYSIADIYFWALWNWISGKLSGAAEFDHIGRWWRRVGLRPLVRAALEAER